MRADVMMVFDDMALNSVKILIEIAFFVNQLLQEK